MIQSARMILIGVLLCSTAYGQSVVAFSIPKSRELMDQKTELRYCSQWLNFVGGNDARVDLLLKKKLTIRLPESHGPGGGYRVPSAVLDLDDCYIVDSQPNSRIVMTKFETTTGTKKWQATIPLLYSNGQGTGPGYNGGFQDIRFLDRGGKRVLQSWNHYAGEFMFVELDCRDGSIKTWFSSKIKDYLNIR